jgi:hypothetical protein
MVDELVISKPIVDIAILDELVNSKSIVDIAMVEISTVRVIIQFNFYPMILDTTYRKNWFLT